MPPSNHRGSEACPPDSTEGSAPSMSEPLRLPIRVLVKGASTVVVTSWMGGPRTDFAFPRVIEAELLAAGYPAEVRTTAMPAERVKHALRNWDEEILTWSPDVVVLQYGQMECIHLFLPRWLERHVNTVRRRPGRLRDFYWDVILRPPWRLLSRLQGRVDRLLPPTLLSHRPRRAAADLRRLIERARWVASPLVLVPVNPPFGPIYQQWFPGANARVEVMNATMSEMVASFEERDVRTFSVKDVAAAVAPPGEEVVPDGGHYSPLVHRGIGRAMAEVILEWAATQPHLAAPTVNGAPLDLYEWSEAGE